MRRRRKGKKRRLSTASDPVNNLPITFNWLINGRYRVPIAIASHFSLFTFHFSLYSLLYSDCLFNHGEKAAAPIVVPHSFQQFLFSVLNGICLRRNKLHRLQKKCSSGGTRFVASVILRLILHLYCGRDGARPSTNHTKKQFSPR